MELPQICGASYQDSSPSFDCANLAIWTVAANETYDDFGVGQVAWLIE